MVKEWDLILMKSHHCGFAAMAGCAILLEFNSRLLLGHFDDRNPSKHHPEPVAGTVLSSSLPLTLLDILAQSTALFCLS